MTYTDQAVVNQLVRHRRTLDKLLKNPDFVIGEIGEGRYKGKLVWYRKEIQKLEKEQTKDLIFGTEGAYWTYSGLAAYVSQLTNNSTVMSTYETPEPQLLPWSKVPKHANRYYQDEAVEALLARANLGPQAISLPTGTGKTKCILTLIKRLGLKTLVMCPSVSIAKQMYKEFLEALGKGKVGFYGAGKKVCKHLVTIGIDDSLVNIEEGSENWLELQKTQVFIIDESHMIAADTGVKIATGLMGRAPYRFAVTATWMRNDGRDLLLEGMTGSPVYEKGINEAVNEGFLAKPRIRMIKLPAAEVPWHPDPNANTRNHLYYNPVVIEDAARRANQAADQQKPVLILIDEIEQFVRLLPFLKHPVQFACGNLSKENRAIVPPEYQLFETDELVKAFNEGQYPILVGTSAVAMGTDFQVPEVGIYLVGGRSQIELWQRFGRMTRGGANSTVVNPWTGVQKTSFDWYDYCVEQDTTERHAKERVRTYEKFFPVEWI